MAERRQDLSTRDPLQPYAACQDAEIIVGARLYPPQYRKASLGHVNRGPPMSTYGEGSIICTLA